MPLNSDAYLRKQGWEGSGSGLRKGALSKPLAIPQKRNLGGLGKDRDEAYPFWDHLFTAASKTITIRLHTDEDSDATPPTVSPTPPSLQRTKTGILSSLRPSASTPYISRPNSPTPRLTLVAAAKQEAARRQLYSLFYRGAALLPELDEPIPDHAPEILDSKPVKKKKRRKELDSEGFQISKLATEARKRNSTIPDILLPIDSKSVSEEIATVCNEVPTTPRKKRRKEREESEKKHKRKKSSHGYPDGTGEKKTRKKKWKEPSA